MPVVSPRLPASYRRERAGLPRPNGPEFDRMHVAITGAAGTVGEVVREAFPAESRTLFTHREHDDIDSELLDVTDREAFVDAVAEADADVLLHLAWVGAPHETWEDGSATNVQATVNAYEAARANDLDRVVLPSSVYAIGMYNRERTDEVESVRPDPDTVVSPDDPPRPDSYYGVAKVTGESLGSYYADRYGIESVHLRIGWVMDPAELRETREKEPQDHRYARANWLSERDCRALFEAAATADLSESAVTLHAISQNADRYLTIEETMQTLGYRPRDDAAAVLDDANAEEDRTDA